MNHREDRFCISCGMTLDANTGGGSTDVICDRCGAINQPGDRFCIRCGNPLGSAAPAPGTRSSDWYAALQPLRYGKSAGGSILRQLRRLAGCIRTIQSAEIAQTCCAGQFGDGSAQNPYIGDACGEKSVSEMEFHQAGDL